MARTIGSYQKRTFLDTNLGRYIYLVEPIIFAVLCPKVKDGFAPDIDMILKMCSIANNKSFKTKRFQSYVEQYVENGLRVTRKRKITKKVLRHYEKIRNSRILKKI